MNTGRDSVGKIRRFLSVSAHPLRSFATDVDGMVLALGIRTPLIIRLHQKQQTEIVDQLWSDLIGRLVVFSNESEYKQMVILMDRFDSLSIKQWRPCSGSNAPRL